MCALRGFALGHNLPGVLVERPGLRNFFGGFLELHIILEIHLIAVIQAENGGGETSRLIFHFSQARLS